MIKHGLPDSDLIGWYEPAIGEQGREPDFVLFGNHQGLLVLEVKDWLIDQIEEADSQNFKIWIGGREENKTNPDKQARGYVIWPTGKSAATEQFQSLKSGSGFVPSASATISARKASVVGKVQSGIGASIPDLTIWLPNDFQRISRNLRVGGEDG